MTIAISRTVAKHPVGIKALLLEIITTVGTFAFRIEHGHDNGELHNRHEITIRTVTIRQAMEVKSRSKDPNLSRAIATIMDSSVVSAANKSDNMELLTSILAAVQLLTDVPSITTVTS